MSAPASQLIAAKQQIFARYATELAGLPAVRFQHEAPWATATRWMTTIVTDPEETGLTAASAAMSWAWNRIAITCGRSCGD